MSDEKNDLLVNEATQEFLGQNLVVGVGLTADGLVFMLSEEAPETEDLITAWAQKREIKPQFIVTGKIRRLY